MSRSLHKDELTLTGSTQQASSESRESRKSENLRAESLLLARATMFVCLPYRQTKAGVIRRVISGLDGGDITIEFTANKIDDGIPLPFGKDRVALACCATISRQKGRPWLAFSEVLPLLDRFGVASSRFCGRGGDRLEARFQRLSNCSVVFKRPQADDGIVDAGSSSPIFDRCILPKRKRGQKHPSPNDPECGIQFGQMFWKDYLQHYLPVPLNLATHFADEPMGWDVCHLVHWASYLAILSVDRGGSGEKVFTRRDLKDLIASEDSNGRRLVSSIDFILAQIRKVWPEMRAHVATNDDLVVSVPENRRLIQEEADCSISVQNTYVGTEAPALACEGRTLSPIGVDEPCASESKIVGGSTVAVPENTVAIKDQRRFAPTRLASLPRSDTDDGSGIAAPATSATGAERKCTEPTPSLPGTIHIQLGMAQIRVEGAVDSSALRVILECLGGQLPTSRPSS